MGNFSHGCPRRILRHTLQSAPAVAEKHGGARARFIISRKPYFTEESATLAAGGIVFATVFVLNGAKFLSGGFSMNLILWLVIGGLIGWIASLIMGTDAQQGIFLNIIVGIIGAFLAGMLLTPLFGIHTINQNNFSLGAMFVSLLGSIILLTIVGLFRHRTV